MRVVLIIAAALTMTGCWSNGQSFVDWHGVWFGCPDGQEKHPAYRGMFGMVKNPSYCEPSPPTEHMKSLDKLKEDFADCRPLGKDGLVDAAVDACMAKKGWHP